MPTVRKTKVSRNKKTVKNINKQRGGFFRFNPRKSKGSNPKTRVQSAIGSRRINSFENSKTLKDTARALRNIHSETLNLRSSNETHLLPLIENFASSVKSKMQETQQPYAKKTIDILGDIERMQQQKAQDLNTIIGKDKITGLPIVRQRFLTYTDLNLLEKEPETFINKYGLKNKGLTNEELSNVLSAYKFKTLSEKLQSMSNVAQRENQRITNQPVLTTANRIEQYLSLNSNV
jgi:hypothetical protein